LDCQDNQIVNTDFQNNGIYTDSPESTIRNCSIHLQSVTATAINIYNADNVNVTNCDLTSNAFAIALTNSDQGTFVGNDLSQNLVGLYFDGSSDGEVSDNLINDNSYGLYVFGASSSNNIEDNEICSNSVANVTCTADQTFNNNKCGSGSVCGGNCNSC
jgi:parallel beta-helix repeat protein